MPAQLSDLERDLKRALDSGDAERLASVRRTIGDGHPETEAGAEANFRLGTYLLLSGQTIDEAVERLRASARAKSPKWSPQARISLALILHRQGKAQQALFELRKAAPEHSASLARAQALAFIAMFELEAGKARESERSRAAQKKVLLELTASADQALGAVAHLLLGMEFKADGDRARARTHLERARVSGELGPDQERTAADALAEL